MKRSKWFGLWNNSKEHYMISQPIKLEEIKQFVDDDSFRIIVKKNKFYEKDGTRPYYNFAIGNCYASAYNKITSKKMQYDDLEEEIKNMSDVEIRNWLWQKGKRLYTTDEAQYIMHRSLEDGNRGYHVGDTLIDDYVVEDLDEIL